jgi:hypothetical protein
MLFPREVTKAHEALQKNPHVLSEVLGGHDCVFLLQIRMLLTPVTISVDLLPFPSVHKSCTLPSKLSSNFADIVASTENDLNTKLFPVRTGVTTTGS